MTEDPDATAGRQVRLPRPALPAEDQPAVAGGGLSLGASIDLAEITRLVLAASVPGFAVGASVFALEHLLKGASRPRRRGSRGQVVGAPGSALSSRGPAAGSPAAPSRRAR